MSFLDKETSGWHNEVTWLRTRINVNQSAAFPKFQHYVPRFLLKRFGTGKNDHVYVYDKHNDTTFRRGASGIGGENGLHDFNFMGSPVSIEPMLAHVEGKAGQHIANVVKRRQLNHFDPLERGELAAFLAIQLVRTPAVAATLRDVFSRMEVWLRANGMPESYFAADQKIGEGENAERAMAAKRIMNAGHDYGPHLVEKDWMLFETSQSTPFIIGDNPLVLHNSADESVQGKHGVMVSGIEIYLPLTPTLMLGLLCPSHREAFDEGIARIDRLSASARSRLSSTRADAAKIIDAMDLGIPLQVRHENVEFFNSLQVLNAERFIFSSSGDFDLAKSMINENESARVGNRMHEATGKF
jgi:hypothetical protein